MSNPTDSTMPSAPEMRALAKRRLRDFFKRKSIKNLVSVLVPSALAVILFPIFGPAAAGTAAAAAVKNGLSLLGLSFSIETVEKLLKPIQGKAIDVSDLQGVLAELLARDPKVNDEAAMAMVMMMPAIKEAALANPKLDADWLGENLENNLNAQGGVMAAISSRVGELVRLDKAALQLAIERLKADWPTINVEVKVTRTTEVSNTKGQQGS